MSNQPTQRGQRSVSNPTPAQLEKKARGVHLYSSQLRAPPTSSDSLFILPIHQESVPSTASENREFPPSISATKSARNTWPDHPSVPKPAEKITESDNTKRTTSRAGRRSVKRKRAIDQGTTIANLKTKVRALNAKRVAREKRIKELEAEANSAIIDAERYNNSYKCSLCACRKFSTDECSFLETTFYECHPANRCVLCAHQDEHHRQIVAHVGDGETTSAASGEAGDSDGTGRKRTRVGESVG